MAVVLEQREWHITKQKKGKEVVYTVEISQVVPPGPEPDKGGSSNTTGEDNILVRTLSPNG